MDEVFHKYPRIKYLGDEEVSDIFEKSDDLIYIEEKIDGANFRFTKINGKLLFGSRNRELDDSSEQTWSRCIEYIRQKDSAHNFPMGFIFYGECIKKHTLEYDWSKLPPILMFDVWCKTKEKFLDDKYKFFSTMGLISVPLIKTCWAKELTEVTDEMVPISEYTPISAVDPQAEGIVFKNYRTQQFAKYVRAKFKECNRRVFGAPKKWAKDDSEQIVAVYCTNARIDKIIFKLLDDGLEINKKLMTKLPELVYRDIAEEHWKEIFFNKKGYNLDFGKIKKLIAKRCLGVLDQIISNNKIDSMEAIK